MMIPRLSFSIGLLLSVTALDPVRADPPSAALSTDRSTAPSADAIRARLIEVYRHQPDLSWILKAPPVYARHPPTADEAAGADRLAALARAARRDGLDGAQHVAVELAAAETLVLAEAQRQAIAARIRISDDEIDARIREQPDLYDEYRMSHIFVAVGETPDHANRSDSEALQRAQMLRGRLENGESFQSLAVAESEDRSTAAEGGMLSSIFGVYMDDVFFPIVRKLAEGQVSAPVRGPQGYHLIRLEQRSPSRPERVRFLAEEALRGERFARAVEATVQAAATRPDQRSADGRR
ncbi:peptidylprolyl isomerase [Methylobacterium mesophilicum]|uniref:peptidylprolyl isomerase n=1 Tax=Methylobacterium mesophilicum TaxID=39956 RepID=UPI002F3227F5